MKTLLGKYLRLGAALVVWAVLLYILLITIIMSDFTLDFSLENQLRVWFGLPSPEPAPSLVQPMLHLFWGTAGSLLALVILQFVTLQRTQRDTLTPRWLAFASVMQLLLGFASALMLALIGLFLRYEQHSGALAFVLSAFLTVRLIVYGVQALRRI